jgi:hypothetical protein
MSSKCRLAPVRLIVQLLRALLRLPLSFMRMLFVGLALGLAPPPPGMKLLRHDDDIVQVEESRQDAVRERT